MIRFLTIFLLITFLFPSFAHAQQIPDAQICRAAISTIMNKKLNEVEFTREVKQVKYVSFAPTKDNSTFKFKCTVEDQRIQWASAFGSWKDSDLDSVVRYEVKEGFLIIRETYNSGYTFNKRFNLKDLTEK